MKAGLNELGDAGGGRGDIEEAAFERAQLKKITVQHFSVTPSKAKVFDTVTVSWQVTIPNLPIDATIALNGAPVATSGTKQVVVQQRSTFALTAKSDLAGVLLKQETVFVDAGDCQDLQIAAPFVVASIKDGFDASFSSGGQFSLQDGGSVVIAGIDGQVDVHVPLAIGVPDWFDATMDIHLGLVIVGNRNIFVTAPVVEVNAGWSFGPNMGSLGIGVLVGDGMSQVAKAFVEHIVDAEIRPAIAASLQAQVDSSTNDATMHDPTGRRYALTTLVFSAARGLQYTICPAAAPA